MANVAHSTLTGSDLHEPKGVSAATSGQIYIADGLGSGAWGSASTVLGITGQIADFGTPISPTGWLECDGNAYSRATYAALFAAVTIQQTGTRTNSSAVITGLSSTANMRAGYSVGGTGITNGTTINSVDSATQITMSAAAGSSGSSTVIVSPWAQGDGSTTFNLPNAQGAGRFRRSRAGASLHMGTLQSDQNQAHTHTSSGTTSTESATHTHFGTTDPSGVDHTHSDGCDGSGGTGFAGSSGSATGPWVRPGSGSTGSATAYSHDHNITTGTESALHTHTYSNTTGSSGSTEARPLALVVMTCIKT